jgi:hypothetical protein
MRASERPVLAAEGRCSRASELRRRRGDRSTSELQRRRWHGSSSELWRRRVCRSQSRRCSPHDRSFGGRPQCRVAAAGVGPKASFAVRPGFTPNPAVHGAWHGGGHHRVWPYGAAARAPVLPIASAPTATTTPTIPAITIRAMTQCQSLPPGRISTRAAPARRRSWSAGSMNRRRSATAARAPSAAGRPAAWSSPELK